MALSKSLAGVGGVGGDGTKRGTGARAKKTASWETGQKVLRFWVDTKSMTVSLPQRKVDDLADQQRAWSTGRKADTMREGGSGTSLQTPSRRLNGPARTILRPSRLHLNGEELVGGGGAWRRTRKREEAERKHAGDIAHGYAVGCIAGSSRKPHEGGWKLSLVGHQR